MNTITIPKDGYKVYRPIVEKFEKDENIDNFFFADVYNNANKSLIEIVQQADQKDSDFLNNHSCKYLENEYSNIIAFTGDRGSGKTSVMRSYTGFLKKREYITNFDDLKNSYFECLPVIDPSHITSNETIIDIVLSRLFTSLDEKIKTYCQKNDSIISQNYRTIFQKFDEVYKAVGFYCQSRKERHNSTASLEMLRHVASGNNLRKLLCELIDLYLKIYYNESKIKSFLVLSIDDLDMNIKQGYEICEELRKYFSLPNVIIFFSLKTNQLNNLVTQEFIESFQNLSKDVKTTTELTESASEMAEKYLEKLIPYKRRCILPDFKIINPAEVDVIFEKNEDAINNKLENGKLVDVVLNLIYDKTGVLLVKDKTGNHKIVPSSLRSIVHFICILKDLKSVKLYWENLSEKIYAIDRQTLFSNLSVIEQYIIENQINGYSNTSYMILKTVSSEPASNLNKRIVELIYQENGFDSKDNEFIKILSERKTLSENISIGDILLAIKIYYRKIQLNSENRHFIAYFKMLYSIRVIKIMFTDTTIGSNSDEFFSMKERLHTLLGGLIYVPEEEKIIRGKKDWEIDQPLEDLKDRDANIKDWAFMHTVYMGKDLRYSLNIPYYDTIDQDFASKGNRIRFFTQSCLSSITNCMMNVNIENKEYGGWIQKYISPIPIMSVDFIDAYSNELITKTAKRREHDAYNLVIQGSKKLMPELFNRMPALFDENLKNYFNGAYTSYVFWNYSPPTNFPFGVRNDLISLKYLKIIKLRILNGIIDYSDLEYNVKLIRNAVSETKSGISKETLAEIQSINESIKRVKAEIENTEEYRREAIIILKNELAKYSVEIETIEETLASLSEPSEIKTHTERIKEAETKLEDIIMKVAEAAKTSEDARRLLAILEDRDERQNSP